MRITRIQKMIAAATLAAAFGFGCAERPTSRPSSPSLPSVENHRDTDVPKSVYAPINARTFLDEARFRAVWSGNLSVEPNPKNIVAGVVNHHALASDLLAAFFRRLKISRPDVTRIIILSPDHYRVGHATISTHLRPYATPDGMQLIDVTSTRLLVDRGIATDESSSTMFEKEHGVGTLVPFLRHEFSDVVIVPLALRGSLPRSEAMSLGETLAEIVDEQTLVIVSADMSHYLSESEAKANDLDTRAALYALDEAWLGRVNDDFTDNGASFVVLRALFGAKNIDPSFMLFDHSISTAYGGPTHDTTSYMTGVWSVR